MGSYKISEVKPLLLINLRQKFNTNRENRIVNELGEFIPNNTFNNIKRLSSNIGCTLRENSV